MRTRLTFAVDNILVEKDHYIDFHVYPQSNEYSQVTLKKAEIGIRFIEQVSEGTYMTTFRGFSCQTEEHVSHYMLTDQWNQIRVETSEQDVFDMFCPLDSCINFDADGIVSVSAYLSFVEKEMEDVHFRIDQNNMPRIILSSGNPRSTSKSTPSGIDDDSLALGFGLGLFF